MSLQLPDGTAWRSPASWWSLTPPSHPYYPPLWESAGGAVIFFYRHLLSPIASSFGSGMLYAARTFLSHLKDASDRPEHCFRHAKVQKTFDTIARFLSFLYIISYSQGHFFIPSLLTRIPPRIPPSSKPINPTVPLAKPYS